MAQGPTLWLWLGGGAAAGDEYIATIYLPEQPWFDAETEDYQNDSTLDVTPAFFAPVIALPIEVVAAQPVAEQFWFEPDPPEPAEDLEQLEFLAPPEAQIHQLIAAQPQPEVEWTQVEFEDYANESALDVTPQLFPPFVAEPIETFASQPHYGEDFDTLVPEETEDYAFAEQLEFLAPPEIPLAELTAVTELREQAWFPDQETEDYAPDQLEVPALYPATAQEPDSTFAAQPLAEQFWFEPEPFIPDEDLEQLEFLAPPEAVIPEIIAAQPHYGEDFDDAAETEDYQQDSTLDLTAFLFPTAQEAVEVFIAQPHYGEWFWEQQDTEDYQGDTDAVPAYLAPVLEPIETFASQPHLGEWLWEDEQTEDYQPATTVDISALTFEALAAIEMLTAQPHYGEAFWPELETEDYQPETDAISAFLAGPPTVPDGLPVCDPDFISAALVGLADVSATPGDGVLVSVLGDMALSATPGDGVLLGTNGEAGEVC